ncbi:hypothetical protein BGX38DRAFT_1274872 [Terfezia claveryi]|nr:hypothetical protein BGX38DRAFT_1274872 [Terfezia claveryi]
MPNRPEKKKTTGKAPTSPAPEPPMQKKRKTTLGAPASPVAKTPTTRTEYIPQKRKTRAELANPIQDVPRRRTRAELALIPPPVEDVPTRRRTRAELAFYPPPIADVPTRSTLRAELAEDVPKNLYAKYADFPWGPQENTQETAWTPAVVGAGQGLERQKVNRVFKVGIKEAEHATTTGRAIGTRRASLTHMEPGNFERLVQRTCDLMFIRKKAYILYQWHQLSDEQKRVYLELQEQEELPKFKIPNAELEAIGVKLVQQFAVVISVAPINCLAYARFDEPTERDTVSGHGTSDTGPNTLLAIDRRIQTIQEELAEGDYDDKPNKQDDDEYKTMGPMGSLEGSSEEEAQSTESDSSKWGKALSVPSGDRPAELLPSNTEDGDYRDSLRRTIANDNNKDDKGEKQVAGDDGGKMSQQMRMRVSIMMKVTITVRIGKKQTREENGN